MAATDYLPTQDALLAAWLEQFDGKLAGYATTLGLSSGDLSAKFRSRLDARAPTMRQPPDRASRIKKFPTLKAAIVSLPFPNLPPAGIHCQRLPNASNH